jgi:hypothetical protein
MAQVRRPYGGELNSWEIMIVEAGGDASFMAAMYLKMERLRAERGLVLSASEESLLKSISTTISSAADVMQELITQWLARTTSPTTPPSTGYASFGRVGLKIEKQEEKKEDTLKKNQNPINTKCKQTRNIYGYQIQCLDPLSEHVSPGRECSMVVMGALSKFDCSHHVELKDCKPKPERRKAKWLVMQLSDYGTRNFEPFPGRKGKESVRYDSYEDALKAIKKYGTLGVEYHVYPVYSEKIVKLTGEIHYSVKDANGNIVG